MLGAHHSKFSKHGQSTRRRNWRRKVGTRPVLPVKVIVCDDSRTAPAYFNELMREVKQRVRLKIVPAKRAATASVVVDRAIAEREVLDKDKKGIEPGDSVWALIDLECEQHLRNSAIAEQERAQMSDVTVALSDPCFEVWTLLHLEDTGRVFTDCDAVIKRIGAVWESKFNQPFPPKAQADYSKIVNMRHDAARRAQQHWDAKDPSRTEIYKVIHEIESHLSPK